MCLFWVREATFVPAVPMRMRTSQRPFWWRVTPRNLEEPREELWLSRRMASVSSCSVRSLMNSLRNAYLDAGKLSLAPAPLTLSSITSYASAAHSSSAKPPR